MRKSAGDIGGAGMERSRRILVVDDDDDLRRVVRRALESENYEVHEAANSTAALAILNEGQCDLVLLDIVLPDSSGFTVIEHVRLMVPRIPVIMMTGTSGLENAVRSVRLGAEDYVAKPFTLSYLLKAIERAIAGQAENPDPTFC
jgi:two-component system response regulator AtoC